MPKLNQILAVEAGQKSRTAAGVTEVYKNLQKPALYAGFTRVYQPKDEEGETFPPESTRVQRRVEADLDEIAKALTTLIDATLTKDQGNTRARGTVRVDGEELFEAPVPFLLFLKKQLDDMRTIVSKVPVLDPAEEWIADENVGGYRNKPAQTTRTRKVPRVLVKYDATERHPAQTEVYTIDEVVGSWTATKFSGAIRETTRDLYLSRINALSDAVKQAIEEANSLEIEQLRVGESIFDFLFEH